MSYEIGGSVIDRIGQYFTKIGTHLRDKRQRASFATYGLGLLGSAERKSVEPIAALACPDPVDCKKLQNRLLSFLGIGR